MDDVTNTFDHVDKYFSIDLSLDSSVHYRFRIVCSTKHFSLYTLVCLVLDTGAMHVQTNKANKNKTKQKNIEFYNLSVK